MDTEARTERQRLFSRETHRRFSRGSPSCVILAPMKAPRMNRGFALLLQLAIALLGVAMLTFLLGEPHLEGRNAHATVFEIYFHDPFLAYVYAGSVPFFVALWRAFGLFGAAQRSGTFSAATVDALHRIRRCGFILLGFVGGGVVIILTFGDHEDRPAGLFMSLLAASGASAIATVAKLAARKLEAALTRTG